MASHIFLVGEIVNLRPIVSRNVPGGAYEVTKQLPHSGREMNIVSRVPAKSTSTSLEKATLPGHGVRRVRHCGTPGSRAFGNFRAECAAVAVLAVGSLLRYSSSLGAKPQRRA
jgi:hypothetical protein